MYENTGHRFCELDTRNLGTIADHLCTSTIALAFLKSSKEDSEILDGDCSMKSMEATVFVVVVLWVDVVVDRVVVLECEIFNMISFF